MAKETKENTPEGLYGLLLSGKSEKEREREKIPHDFGFDFGIAFVKKTLNSIPNSVFIQSAASLSGEQRQKRNIILIIKL